MIRIVTSSGVDYVAAFNLNFLNLFQNLFRFELLRDSWTLSQWRHLREYQTGYQTGIFVQVSRRIFRHQLWSGGQRLRYGSLPSRRHLYRYNHRRDQWHKRQYRRRWIIQL